MLTGKYENVDGYVIMNRLLFEYHSYNIYQ